MKRGNSEDKNCGSWMLSKFVHFGLTVLLLLAAVVRVLHHLVFVVSEPDRLVQRLAECRSDARSSSSGGTGGSYDQVLNNRTAEHAEKK